MKCVQSKSESTNYNKSKTQTRTSTMIKPNDHIRQVINNEQESKMAGPTACTKTSKTETKTV